MDTWDPECCLMFGQIRVTRKYVLVFRSSRRNSSLMTRFPPYRIDTFTKNLDNKEVRTR